MSHLDACGKNVVECLDYDAHIAEANSQSIPGCFPYRFANRDAESGAEALYCDSEHCGRCQELRRFRGEEPLDHGAAFHAAAVDEAHDVLADALKRNEDAIYAAMDIMSLAFRNIPAEPLDAEQWQLRAEVTHQISRKSEEWMAHPGADEETIRRAFLLAAGVNWPTELLLRAGFLKVAHTYVHILTSDPNYITLEEE